MSDGPERRLPRRGLLRLGGLAALGLSGAGLLACSDRETGGSESPPATGGPSATPGGPAQAGWSQPGDIVSKNGVLETELLVEGKRTRFGDRERWAITVNGTSPGPTLRVRPGDVLRLRLKNRLSQATNLHTHGLRVSPAGNADNPFLDIKAGADFDYEIPVPDDHPGGLFWYHPHRHHSVAAQLFAGFFGAIVVEDSRETRAEVTKAQDRLVMLSDGRNATTEQAALSATAMEQREGREGDLLFVNGLTRPALTTQAGVLERWRFLNASPSRFYRVSLEGHSFHLFGSDGGPLGRIAEASNVTLVPGERVEVLVRPVKAGTYRLLAGSLSRGSMGGSGMGGGGGDQEIASMSVTGADAAAAALPGDRAVEPLPGRADRTRTVQFEMRGGPGGASFYIDGRQFDAARVDIATKLGTTEDWTIQNIGMMDHPFHLHIWPFQVLAQSSGQPAPGWKDVVNIPAGGWVRVRIPFRQTGGKTVFHCHILDHEDLGMMATIEAT